jgi:hypothetical protein
MIIIEVLQRSISPAKTFGWAAVERMGVRAKEEGGRVFPSFFPAYDLDLDFGYGFALETWIDDQAEEALHVSAVDDHQGSANVEGCDVHLDCVVDFYDQILVEIENEVVEILVASLPESREETRIFLLWVSLVHQDQIGSSEEKL